MNINEAQVEDLVQNIVKKVIAQTAGLNTSKVTADKGDWGVFKDMNDAVEAAYEAFLQFKERSIQCRKKFIDAVKQMTYDHKETLARMTVEETKMGRIEHKIAKFENAARNSPGVEYLQPKAFYNEVGKIFLLLVN